MTELINGAKRMQLLAGLITEAQVNELDSNVQKLRSDYLKKLDTAAKAIADLDNDGGLFKVDKGAEEAYNKFFDAYDNAYKAWGPLYQYVKGTTPPKLGTPTTPFPKKPGTPPPPPPKKPGTPPPPPPKPGTPPSFPSKK